MNNQRRLFSYKLTSDYGFAPNPFGGYLTLATCKPGIRRSKRVGDWIAGFTSHDLTGDPVGRERLIFLMQIDMILPFADYYRSDRFAFKIPVEQSNDPYNAAGDNIYKPLIPNAQADDDFERNPLAYHSLDDKHHDLSGKNVLIAIRFAYFGRGAIEIPATIRPRVPLGQHPYGWLTCDPGIVDGLIDYVEGRAGLKAAVVDLPTGWRSDQASCAKRIGCSSLVVKPQPSETRKKC